jgi:hypothetical protein
VSSKTKDKLEMAQCSAAAVMRSLSDIPSFGFCIASVLSSAWAFLMLKLLPDALRIGDRSRCECGVGAHE